MIPSRPLHSAQKLRLLKDKYEVPFVIRFYQDDEKDFPSLAAMYRGFEPKEWSQGLPPRLEQKREEWLRYVVDKGINLLAIMERDLVGHAALFEIERGSEYEYLIFVHQDYQDRGIGTALSLAMRDLAQEMECSKIWLTVGAINRKAIHVYEKVGFCIVGPRDVECVMMLALNDDNAGR
jgi:ribosomal protein S18 acetylase RimI-like enzyme